MAPAERHRWTSRPVTSSLLWQQQPEAPLLLPASTLGGDFAAEAGSFRFGPGRGRPRMMVSTGSGASNLAAAAGCGLRHPRPSGSARGRTAPPPLFCSVTSATAAAAVSAQAARGGGKAGNGAGGGGGADGGSGSGSSGLERLPVAVKKGDQLLPYVWDGRRISAMEESALQESDRNTGRLRNWALGLQRRLAEAFLPDPRDVTPDYWDWLRWRLSQRFFSSTMQNFSFSALLLATGLGAKKAFAASAAINWLLKDGVSRIVRMSVATSFGQTFDADLKRMRFVTSLIFTACMAGEFATPFWPQHFVALASVSSVGRAVGLSAFVAVQPAFQAALATGGNLADLTSKNQAQHMVMDMLALGVSAGLTWLCRSMPRGGLLLPALAYPLCAAGDLTCIWHELKAVQLRTLNRERAEMVIQRWLERGAAPGAAEISAAENLVLPSDVWGGVLPLTITSLEAMAGDDPGRLRGLLGEFKGEEYVLAVAAPGRRGAGAGAGGGLAGWAAGLPLPGAGALAAALGRSEEPRLQVSLSDRASPADITKALLHAAYLRKAALEHLRLPLPLAPACPGPAQRADDERGRGLERERERQRGAAEASGGAVAAAVGPHAPNHGHPHSGLSGSTHTHPSSDHSSHAHAQPHTACLSLSRGPAGAGGGGGGGGPGEASGSRGEGGGASSAQAPSRRAGAEEAGAPSVRGGAEASCSGQGQGQGQDHGEGEGQGRGWGWGWGRGQPSLHSLQRRLHSAHAAAPAPGPGPHAAPPPAASSSALEPPAPHAREGAPPAAAAPHHHPHPSGPGPSGGEGGRGPRGQGSGGRRGGPRWSEVDDAAWGALVRRSRAEAGRALPRLLQQAEEAGWRLRPFMLSTTERVQFVRLAG
ncbi:hypothetical protein HYH03_013541 [Edaphochlamys debaryana]|uniref:Protein root UVB sensitive/RUS domain-containing protein n=1 Tax=Edaphochlamys debaryana TaxID=47281 RepID=A0A836BUE6_9CHLO|nr:hypothetical protein HYH03_013541 [Edaphochlamys debaryana]|eukprot:KAG2487824.1 hypothetical protein HYH03_013541 [Edaphochlamys debaryana]